MYVKSVPFFVTMFDFIRLTRSAIPDLFGMIEK
jgi:hypothetical protein